jgi:hypothetical protein
MITFTQMGTFQYGENSSLKMRMMPLSKVKETPRAFLESGLSILTVVMRMVSTVGAFLKSS